MHLMLVFIVVLLFKVEIGSSRSILDCQNKGFVCYDETRFYQCVESGNTTLVIGEPQDCPEGLYCNDLSDLECDEPWWEHTTTTKRETTSNGTPSTITQATSSPYQTTRDEPSRTTVLSTTSETPSISSQTTRETTTTESASTARESTPSVTPSTEAYTTEETTTTSRLLRPRAESICDTTTEAYTTGNYDNRGAFYSQRVRLHL
ncbi:unnamed protein product [Callosobruchus maculatus]|uniref:Chitin-binding type-2 domain-containing protein n=1 Tax=Callosobruchus maculatus TaxID=64391 RepID=A0A653DHJ9_CALMS|nr:unnamed protein product [Callosobruchus maculatus]